MRFLRIFMMLLGGLALGCHTGTKQEQLTSPASGTGTPSRLQKTGVPDKVCKVLDHIKIHGKAPEGYAGGRKFGNFERLLPETENGKKIKYREWDVNPRSKRKNRGKERLVTGSNGRAYYTADHYQSFAEIPDP